MIKEIVDVYFFYWFIPLCILMFLYLYWDTYLSDQCKPKYRRDKDGYVQFYYRRYSWWIDFPIWKDNNDIRQVEVNDRVRDINYTLTYVGPGRAKWKLIFDDCAPITQHFITKHVRELYPEFKNSEQLWQLHNLYVDKENIILNDIVKNHKFKAYESNS